jgi:hypothetical protein
MKKTWLAVGIVLCATAWGADLLACGDKFLVVSRGTRFQRAGTARHGANILVYASPSSTLPKSLAKAEPDTTLLKAGYRPTLAQDAGQLDEALRQGGWSLVVVDLADSAVVKSKLSGKDAPMIVPVLLAATGTEVAQAKKDYQRVIKGPIKSQAFIEAIDDAMALREKLQSKSAA